MKLIEIKEYPFQHTAEISQLIQYKYAFVSPDNKQAHTLVYCRDFLQDAVRNQLFGREDGIWGFRYKPGIDPVIEVDYMKMLVADVEKSATQFYKEMEKALLILHLFEKDAGMELSEVFKVKEYRYPAVVFQSHKDWVLSPFLISLHTFLVRLAARPYEFKTLPELQACLAKDKHLGGADNDNDYIKATHKYLHKILPNRNYLMFDKNRPKGGFDQGNIGQFHDHTGIVSLCRCSLYDENLKKIVKEKIINS